MTHRAKHKLSEYTYRILTGLIAAVFAVAFNVVPVHAQSQEEIDAMSLMGHWHQYVPGDGPLGPCATPSGGGPINQVSEIPLRGAYPIEIAYNYFIDRGLQPHQAAGIVGNLIAESGVDPKANQPGGPGRGIAQWSEGDRWDRNPRGNVVGFAQQRGKHPEELGVQLDFLWFELINFYKGTFEKIRASTTVGQAAVIFMIEFEAPKDRRPDGPNARKRTELAAGVLLKHGGGAPPSTTPTGTGINPCGPQLGGGGLGVGSKLTFPVRTTKTRVTGNKPGWCYQSQVNCHHHYNAADIMLPEGEVVVAANPGRVVRASSVSGSHASVQILGADGYVYFYQHLAPNSLEVNTNAQVTAGQPLGLIGNRVAAFNTPTHLHFDMLPPPYTGRVSCASAGCMRYPFMNVQPALIDAYQHLPQ